MGNWVLFRSRLVDLISRYVYVMFEIKKSEKRMIMFVRKKKREQGKM